MIVDPLGRSAVALPLGFDQVPGSEPIGRPLESHQPISYVDGTPFPGVEVLMVQRVTGDDPVAVFRNWVQQLTKLHGGTVWLDAETCGPPRAPHPEPWRGPWCHAGMIGMDARPDGGGDLGQFQLWATDRDPLLVLTLTHRDWDLFPTDIAGELVPTPEPDERIVWTRKSAGDRVALLDGTSLRIPAGMTTLTPTNRSTSTLTELTLFAAAGAPRDAVRAMLRAVRRSPDGPNADVTGPLPAGNGDVRVWRAQADWGYGGGTVEVWATRASGDQGSTVYLSVRTD